MSTDIDWRHEIDASFGSGEDMPVGHYVTVGQRAVRRRRRSAAAAGLAAAAVVAGVAWGIAPGTGPTRSETPPVATDPSATADGRTTDPWLADDPPARFDGAGVEVREGAVVHERRDDLHPGKPTESAALDVSYGGERWWVAMEWDDGGATYSTSRPRDGLFDSFDAFVRDQVRGGGMISRPWSAAEGQYPWAGLVDWDGGEVVARRGVEVVATVEDPVATADDSLGLVLRDGAETTWMLITLDPSGGSSASTKESESGWATFDDWLADQVALAQGGDVPEPVRLDGAKVVAATPGVEVLEQQADPDLRAYGTSAVGATSAVALVEWKDERWFVLAVDDSVTTVAVDKAGGATTLDEFVAFMADKADEGGMR